MLRPRESVKGALAGEVRKGGAVTVAKAERGSEGGIGRRTAARMDTYKCRGREQASRESSDADGASLEH